MGRSGSDSPAGRNIRNASTGVISRNQGSTEGNHWNYWNYWELKARFKLPSLPYGTVALIIIDGRNRRLSFRVDRDVGKW